MSCSFFEKKSLFSLTIDGKGTYGIAASAVDYDEKLPTYLRITDINDDGTLNKSSLKSVDDKDASKYVLKENDIVFARTGGSTGRNYFYNPADGEYVYAGFLIKFSIDPDKVNPKFVKYYCQSNEYRNWVHSYNTGSTRGNINAQTFGSMTINVPPRYYQDALVKILSSIDNKIEINNKINDNLQQQAFTLFEEQFHDVRNGDFKIGNYLTPKRGKNLLTKNAKFGNVPVVAGGLEPSTYHNVSNTNAPVITISASGANAGFINLWNVPVWSSDSSFIDNSVTKYVYFWYVLLKKRQQEIFDSQTGSAQAHIYPKHIEILNMSRINENDMLAYNKLVTPLFEAIGQNKLYNQKLSELRDVILPKLMSGEIDVSNVKIDL